MPSRSSSRMKRSARVKSSTKGGASDLLRSLSSEGKQRTLQGEKSIPGGGGGSLCENSEKKDDQRESLVKREGRFVQLDLIGKGIIFEEKY